jgi:hypothetical protein
MGKGIDNRWGAMLSGVVGTRRGCRYRWSLDHDVGWIEVADVRLSEGSD